MSDKTTAALAAEQADTEATTTQEAELLPAAHAGTSWSMVDLGAVAEGERAPFRITDDRCADWAIRKIADERSEYNRPEGSGRRADRGHQ